MANIEKPPHGEPCNSCGLCCIAEPCTLGGIVFKQQVGRCPALEQAVGGFRCGLVVSPEKYAPERVAAYTKETMSDCARLLIGANIGCDAQADGEPRSPALVARMIAYRDKFADIVPAAMFLWFGKIGG